MRHGVDLILKAVAFALGLFAVVFVFLGVLWTEWPQLMVGIVLALVGLFGWNYAGRGATRLPR